MMLQILRQTTTVFDIARLNDLTPSDVQEYVDTFLKAGEHGFNARASGEKDLVERVIKELKATVGEIYVENAIL
jgi:hypothetical protein